MDFPTSPIVGELYITEAYTWQWNGVGWQLLNKSSKGFGTVTIRRRNTSYELVDLPAVVTFDIT